MPGGTFFCQLLVCDFQYYNSANDAGEGCIMNLLMAIRATHLRSRSHKWEEEKKTIPRNHTGENPCRKSGGQRTVTLQLQEHVSISYFHGSKGPHLMNIGIEDIDPQVCTDVLCNIQRYINLVIISKAIIPKIMSGWRAEKELGIRCFYCVSLQEIQKIIGENQGDHWTISHVSAWFQDVSMHNLPICSPFASLSRLAVEGSRFQAMQFLSLCTVWCLKSLPHDAQWSLTLKVLDRPATKWDQWYVIYPSTAVGFVRHLKKVMAPTWSLYVLVNSLWTFTDKSDPPK